MAAAQGYIPVTNQYQVPEGLTKTSTPQGGDAYTDVSGKYGVPGAVYLPGAYGYTLAPSLPGQLGTQAPAPGQGNSPVISPAAVGTVNVQPEGTTVKTQQSVPTYDPSLAMAAKGPLEQAANAAGLSLSSSPTVPVRSSGATQTQKAVAISESLGLSDILAKLGPAPTTPSAVDTYNTLSSAQGIPALQSRISALDKEIADATNATQNNINIEKGKPVVNTIINGRVAKISADAAEAINRAKTDRDNLVTQLTNANNTVTKLMSLQDTDYQRAHQDYVDRYNKAIQLFDAQQTKMTKEQSAASANAKIIIDAYKGSKAPITSTDQVNWNTLESQSGLPSGFIESAIKAQQNSGVKIDHWSTGSDGTTYAYGRDATGNPVLLKAFPGTGKASGKSTSTSSEQKTIDAFNKALTNRSALDRAGTREQFIRQLQAQFPSIALSSIQEYVYGTYPDSYKTK